MICLLVLSLIRHLFFRDERFIDLLKGNFRDGEAKKTRISHVVIQLCRYIKMNCGMEVVRQRNAIIKQCAENYMNERNLGTLQRTVSVDNKTALAF